MPTIHLSLQHHTITTKLYYAERIKTFTLFKHLPFHINLLPIIIAYYTCWVDNGLVLSSSLYIFFVASFCALYSYTQFSIFIIKTWMRYIATNKLNYKTFERYRVFCLCLYMVIFLVVVLVQTLLLSIIWLLLLSLQYELRVRSRAIVV